MDNIVAWHKRCVMLVSRGWKRKERAVVRSLRLARAGGVVAMAAIVAVGSGALIWQAGAAGAVGAVRCDSPARRERCCRRRRRRRCSIWCQHGVLEFRPWEPLNTLEPPPYPASCVPGSQTIIAVFPAACSTRVAWHHRKNIRALSGQRHHVTGPHPPRPSWQRTATAHPPSTSYLHLRSAKIAAYCLPAAHSYT
jgi:hypothetical protein